jgi:hypothetical protein
VLVAIFSLLAFRSRAYDPEPDGKKVGIEDIRAQRIPNHTAPELSVPAIAAAPEPMAPEAVWWLPPLGAVDAAEPDALERQPSRGPPAL